MINLTFDSDFGPVSIKATNHGLTVEITGYETKTGPGPIFIDLDRRLTSHPVIYIWPHVNAEDYGYSISLREAQVCLLEEEL